MLGNNGVTATANRSFLANAHRNVDATGVNLSISGSQSLEVSVPAGNANFDAPNTINVQSATGSLNFQGDTGASLDSVFGSTTLSSANGPYVSCAHTHTHTEKERERERERNQRDNAVWCTISDNNVCVCGCRISISSNELTQIQADATGLSIAATSGDVSFVSTNNVAFSAGGLASLVSSNTFSIMSTNQVYVHSYGSVTVLGTSAAALNAPKDVLQGGALSVLSNSTTVIQAVNDVNVRSTDSVSWLAGDQAQLSSASILLSAGKHSVVQGAAVSLTSKTLSVTSGCEFQSNTQSLLTISSTGKTLLQAGTGAASVLGSSVSLTGTPGATLTGTSGERVHVVGSTSLSLDAQTGFQVNTIGNQFYYTDTAGLVAGFTAPTTVTVTKGLQVGSRQAGTTLTAGSTLTADAYDLSFETDVLRLTASMGAVSLLAAQQLVGKFSGDLNVRSPLMGQFTATRIEFDNSGAWQRFNGLLQHTESAPLLAGNALEYVRFTTTESWSIESTQGVLSQSNVDTSIATTTGSVTIVAATTAVYNSNGNVTAVSGGALSLASSTAPNGIVFLGAERLEGFASNNVAVSAPGGTVSIATSVNSDSSVTLTAARDGTMNGAPSATIQSDKSNVTLAGAASSTVTAEYATSITTNNGGDFTAFAGGNLTATVGESLTVAANDILYQAVVESVRDGSLFESTQSVSLSSTANDVYSRANGGSYSATAGGALSVVASTSDGVFSASQSVQVTGGQIHAKSTSGPVVFQAQGGGVFMSTSRYPDLDNQTYSDIVFNTATQDIVADASRNLTFSNFNGFVSGTAQRNVVFGGGDIHHTTGTGQTYLLQGAGGVSFASGNEENLYFTAGYDFLQSVQHSSTIVAHGLSQVTQDGVLFRATQQNVCFSAGPDALTFSFSGYRGVLIESTDVGSNIAFNAAFESASTAQGSVGLSSYGWSFDPLDVAGLRVPLGVLLRTTAPGGSIQISTTAADIELRALEQVNLTSIGAVFTITDTGYLDLRTTGYLGDLNLLTFAGSIGVTASGNTFLRAGTRSIDADLRANATQTLSISTSSSAGSILFQQLGTNSDTVTDGISLFSEKGSMDFVAAAGTFTIDTSDGNGFVNMTAETQGVTITAASGNVALVSQRARVLVQGQRSASLVSTSDIVSISASGKEGTFTASSAGLADLQFVSGVGTTSFSAPLGSVSLTTLTGITAQTKVLTLSGADNALVSAGGSLSLVGSNSITLSALRTDLFAQAEMRIDSPGTVSTVVSGLAPLVRIGAGGDEVQEGIKIISTGAVALTSGTDAHLYGVYLYVESGTSNNFQSSTGDVSLSAAGQLGGGIVGSSLGGPVSLTSTAGAVSIATVSDYQLLTNTKIAVTASATITEQAAKQLDMNAPAIGGSITLESTTKVLIAATDMMVATATDISITGAAGISLVAEDYVSFDSTDVMSFSAASAPLAISSSGAQSPVVFQTLGSTSGITVTSSSAAAPLAISAAGLVSLVGSNGAIFQSTNGKVSLSVPNDLLSAKADNRISLTAQLQLLLQANNGGDITFEAANRLDVLGTQGVTFTTAANLITNISGTIRISDSATATDSAWVSNSASTTQPAISTSSAGNTVFTSTTGAYAVTSTNWIDITSHGADPTGNGVLFQSGMTLAATATTGSLFFNSQHNVAFSAATVMMLSSGTGSATFESTGPAGIAVSGPTTVITAATGTATLTGADGVSIVSPTITGTATTGVLSFTATGGNFLTNVASTAGAISLASAKQLVVNAVDQGLPDTGVISFLSAATTGLTLTPGANLNVFASNNIDIISTISTLTVAPSAVPIGMNARNQVTWQSNGSGSASPSISITATGITTFTANNGDINLLGRGGSVSLTTTAAQSFTATDFTFLAGNFISSANGNVITSTTDAISIISNEGSVVFSRANANSDISFLNTKSQFWTATKTMSLASAGTVKILPSNGNTILTTGRSVLYQDFKVANPATTGPALFQSGDSIFFNPAAGFSSIGSVAQSLSTSGPQSDAKLWADAGMILVGNTAGNLQVLARQNLGPIEGYITTKEYNYHAIEYVAVEGSVTATSVNTVMTSTRGAVQYRAQNEICYGRTLSHSTSVVLLVIVVVVLVVLTKPRLAVVAGVFNREHRQDWFLWLLR